MQDRKHIHIQFTNGDVLGVAGEEFFDFQDRTFVVYGDADTRAVVNFDHVDYFISKPLDGAL